MSEPVGPLGVATPLRAKPSRNRWWIGLLLVMVLLTGYVCYWPRPRVALGVLTAHSATDGKTVTMGEVSPQPHLAAQMTAVKSNVSATTTTTTSNSDEAVALQRTIAVFNQSDHLLMERTGLALFEGLRATNQFEQVQYVPYGKSLPVGQVVPDILVVLDMPSLQESGLPGSRRYQAEITLRFGRDYAHGTHSTHSLATPPVVQLQGEHRVEYDAQQTGLETSGALYTAVSQDLAMKLLGALLKPYEKSVTASLPDKSRITEFFPAFDAAPDLPVLKRLQAQLQFQGPRFMEPCTAAWIFRSTATADELQSEFTRDLPEAEWKTHQRSQAGQPFACTWTRGVESITVLADARRMSVTAAPDAASVQTYSILYGKQMSIEAAETAFRALLDRQPTTSELLPFAQYWFLERDRMQTIFREHPPVNVAALLRLAEWEQQAGHDETARIFLLRAHTLDRLVGKGKHETQLKTLAKKLGLLQLPKSFDPAVIATLGFIDLRTTPEATVTVRSGEERIFWLAGDESEQKLLTVTLSRRPDSTWIFGHEVRVIRDGSSSFGSTSPFPIDLTRPEPIFIAHYDADVEIIFSAGDDSQSLKLSVKRSKSIQ